MKTAKFNETSKSGVNFELFYSESGMPGVAIKYNGETHYLYPFRGYRFQLCGNKDGENDMGSTQVVGLKNLMGLSPIKAGPYYSSNISDITSEMFAEMAELALRRSSWYNSLPGCKFTTMCACQELGRATREWLETV